MNTVLVHRRPRRPADEVALHVDRVRLSPPPAVPDAAGGPTAWTYALFPVLGSVGMLVIALVNRNPLFLIAGAVFVLGSLGMGLVMFTTMRGRTATQRFESRDRYFAHLATARGELARAAQHQREHATTTHPDPAVLTSLVAQGSRTWERRPGDPDFLHLRAGVGTVAALAAPAGHPEPPTATPDPAAADAARRLVGAAAEVPGVPVALVLRPGTTTLVGDGDDVRSLARALVAQLAALHAPDDVRLAVATSAGPAARAAWEHVKWLPHARHPAPPEGHDEEPLLIADTLGDLAVLLEAELERRRRSATQRGATLTSAAASGPALVVLVDGPIAPGEAAVLADAAETGVALVHLVHGGDVEGAAVDVSVLVGPAGGGTAVAAGTAGAIVDVVERSRPQGVDEHDERPPAAREVRADALDVASADALARALAPLRLSRQVGEASLSEVSDLPALLGIADVASVDVAAAWRPRPQRSLLSVPIGVDAQGRPVHLDLKEAALDGMGPHGLVVGATGSGKSELLRTLVTALALTHGPDDLAMVLVDFKGGATFAGFSALPHVAGSVTDLEDDPDTVHRFAAALRGELRRRERALREAGLASVREHRAARLAGAALAPLPHLLVVVDEFSELLSQEPDLIDDFVTIGRLGRSLGVHLLMATQRLEEGRLRGLDSHLSYRIALRTFSAAESRTVIGTAQAYELPPVPGSAYLKVGTFTLQRLRVATVSAPYLAPAVAAARASRPPGPVAFTAHHRSAVALPALGLDLSDPSQRSTLGVVVDTLAGAAPKVAPVWLPPLPARVVLHELLGTPRRARGRGLTVDGPGGALRVPLGIGDHPEQQAQRLFTVDLTVAGGHVGLVGGPGSGKSTALATLVTSLALTHTPAQVQVYCLDLGGGSLAGLADLPHVGVVAPRSRPEVLRRTVAQVTALLDAREGWFAAARIESVAALRATRHPDTGVPLALDAENAEVAGAHRPPPGDLGGDVVLVVDGWAVLRAEMEDLEGAITSLAVRGAAYGVHVVIATPRWMDLRPALKDALGTRLELRLGEAADSVFTRAAARALPAVPGRMLTAGDVRVQAALPETSLAAAADRGAAPAPASPAELGRALAAAWDSPVVAPVRLLPALVGVRGLDAVGGAPHDGPGVAIGLREADLRAQRVDLLAGPDPHLLVLGDARSGRTTALRTLLGAMTERYGPEELLVVVVDYRRGLLDAVDDAHLSRYCASAPAAAGVLAELAERLAKRLPGPDVTREQLRAGTWWSGPRALVVVDDHDLVSASGPDPVAALVELLPVARDVGLHLVLARAGGGVATAMMAPVLRRLRELGTPGLLLSGPGEEGAVLHGGRMRSLTPGRALHVTRTGAPRLVQVAVREDEAAPPP